MASSSASATVAVDKATSDLLLGPDWTTNMEICDSVNSLHWQAKDVVKAVKKRLQHKSPRVQHLALTLLEALVKNCGDYLHHQVAEKNILGEMVKIVKKKVDMQVRDKILVMLDSWQQAFGGPEGKYPQYYWAYDELRRSGVEFPRRSPDASPIITPPVSHPTLRHPQGGYGSPQAGYGGPQAGYGLPQLGYGMPSGSSRRLDEAMASEVEGLSLSSIESMRDVMDLLGDMLQAVDPCDREAVKDEVIVELVERCRSNQKKLMQMLTSTGDDELLGRGLDLNDSLQILLARHDAIASGSPLPVQALKPADSSPKTSEAKDSSSIAGSSSPVPATVSTGKSPVDEEDEEEEDEFAQLARRHSKSPASVTTDPASSESHIAASNTLALALPDPPPPVNTTREQDMIDLLSMTLSSTPLPPSSQAAPPPPTVSDQNTQIYTQAVPQYNGYVAPWAQPRQQQQPQTQQGYSQPQQPQTQQGYSQPQQPQTQQGYSQPQQPQTQQGYSQPQQPQTQQGYSQPQQPQTQQGYSQPQQPQTQQGYSQPQQPQTQQGYSQPQQPQTQQGYSQPQQPQTQQRYSQPQQPQTQQGYSQPQQPQTQQGYSQPQQPQTQKGYSQPQQPQTQQRYSQPQQPQTQQAYSQPQAQFQMQPQTRPQNPYEYPPPPWASTSANAYYTPRANATASYTERSLQQSISFPTRAGDPQATSSSSNPGVSLGQKLFVPSSRLFEDLDVFGSTEGKHNNKSTNSNNASQGLSGSQTQQSMIGGRKMI